jgi:hypothetical protein
VLALLQLSKPTAEEVENLPMVLFTLKMGWSLSDLDGDFVDVNQETLDLFYDSEEDIFHDVDFEQDARVSDS